MKMDKKPKEKLIEEKIRFTRFWVNKILNSSNKERSTEQKEFIDTLYEKT